MFVKHQANGTMLRLIQAHINQNKMNVPDDMKKALQKNTNIVKHLDESFRSFVALSFGKQYHISRSVYPIMLKNLEAYAVEAKIRIRRWLPVIDEETNLEIKALEIVTMDEYNGSRPKPAFMQEIEALKMQNAEISPSLKEKAKLYGVTV